MLNMITGDFYRLRHSKGFYITELVLITFILATVLTGTLGSVSARPSSSSFSAFQQANTDGHWNSVTATKLMTSMCSFLVYLILPLFIMTIGFEFSSGSYKSLLSSGMTRANYFCSKYTVFIIIILIQFILYYGAVYTASGMSNNWGNFTVSFGIKMSQVILFQLLLILAIFAVAILIMFLTFSATAAIITTIVWQFLVAVFRMIFIHATWLKFFDFQGTIDTAFFVQMSPRDSVLYIFTAFATIITCALLSFYSFKQKNL
ncbi:hypothetical protein [Paucilactobacillus hokkaidonensis]|nr:hypothetical protein [Paucilactobacillus hokkaidonensis]